MVLAKQTIFKQQHAQYGALVHLEKEHSQFQLEQEVLTSSVNIHFERKDSLLHRLHWFKIQIHHPEIVMSCADLATLLFTDSQIGMLPWSNTSCPDTIVSPAYQTCLIEPNRKHYQR